MDPDGKYAYSVEINDGEYSVSTLNLKEKVLKDSIGFFPFGGTSLMLVEKFSNIKNLDSSEFDSLKKEIETYATDVLSNLGECVDSLKSFSSNFNKVVTLMTIFQIGMDVINSYDNNSKIDIDTLTNDVLHKLCNYSIKGKSHNEVAKKFFFAKGVVSGLLDSGKINYTKDWKNDIKSIMVYDRETFNILKQLKKELDKIGD